MAFASTLTTAPDRRIMEEERGLEPPDRRGRRPAWFQIRDDAIPLTLPIVKDHSWPPYGHIGQCKPENFVAQVDNLPF